MSEPRKYRPGDAIIDRYLADLGSGDRELARERLQQWMRWKLGIYMDRARLNMSHADSREQAPGATIESASSPPS